MQFLFVFFTLSFELRYSLIFLHQNFDPLFQIMNNRFIILAFFMKKIILYLLPISRNFILINSVSFLVFAKFKYWFRLFNAFRFLVSILKHLFKQTHFISWNTFLFIDAIPIVKAIFIFWYFINPNFINYSLLLAINSCRWICSF